jgi:glutathione S-transferase
MVKYAGGNGNARPAQRAAKLYVIPGSHACRAGMLMLDHAGLDYRPVEIPTGLQGPLLRAHRFPGKTTPALSLDGRRLQTNRGIARFLEGLVPGHPLFPSDPALRAEVEEAERFADECLQTLARRLVLAAGSWDLESLVDYGDSGRLGPILARNRRRRGRIMRIAARHFFKIDDHTEQLDLAALPAVLDRVDGWIRSGVLNGERLNAADFQIAPSICLLAYRRDLGGEIEGRPVWRLADRLLPGRADPSRAIPVAA